MNFVYVTELLKRPHKPDDLFSLIIVSLLSALYLREVVRRINYLLKRLINVLMNGKIVVKRLWKKTSSSLLFKLLSTCNS